MRILLIITAVTIAGLVLYRKNKIPVYDLPSIFDDIPYYGVGGHPLDN